MFNLSDGSYTRDQLVARFQSYVASVEQTKSSYQVWRSYVADEHALELQVRPLRAGVRGIVQARFGKQGTQVLQFGFTPVKVAVRTAESKALAAKKAAATRQARGTVGKKKKATITGATAAAAAPVTPAAPSAAPTPQGASPAPSPVPAAAAVAAPAAPTVRSAGAHRTDHAPALTA